jgi:Dolichyl-phosphate-mannose-protein mannosyltransferase
MRLLAPILANLILIVAAFGLGSLLRALFPKQFSSVDRLATILLAGLGLLGALLFLIGLIHLSLSVMLIVLLPCAMLGVFALRKEWPDLRQNLRLSEIPKLPALVIALILLITFIGGLAEPVGDIKMDAIAYHFLGPHIWLRDASIHVIPDESLSAFPATVETLYAALMAVGGTRGPELFAFLSIGLLLLVSYGFAVRLGLDSAGAWWAIALIATMPVVYRGAYGGFVDAIFSGFLLLALRFALDARTSADFALSGIFAGLTMATKYTGIPAFVLIVIAALALEFVSKSISPNHLKGLLLLAVTACVVASPWYLRNWLVLGSPMYPPPPSLLRFFHIKYMSPDAVNSLAAIVRREGLGMGHSFPNLLLLPFHLTFHPANFLNGPGGVGLALLALAPFGILLRWRDPFVGALVLFSFIEIFGWFVTEQDARFLIHVYILLAIFAIWGWSVVAERSPRTGRILSGAAVACSILYGLGLIVPARIPDLHAAFSPAFEKRRKFEEIPYLESFSLLDANAAAEKVLVLEPRVPTFYLNKNYLKPVGRFGEQSIPEGNDFRLLDGKLSAYGITHILDVRLDDNGFRVPPGQPNLQLIFERDDQRIYRVSPLQ